MVALEVVALVLTGLGITASIIYYANILQNANKTQKVQLETRQAQLFMQIYNRFQEIEFRQNFNDVLTREWDDYDDYVKKYGRINNPLAQAKSASIGLFFDGLPPEYLKVGQFKISRIYRKSHLSVLGNGVLDFVSSLPPVIG